MEDTLLRANPQSSGTVGGESPDGVPGIAAESRNELDAVARQPGQPAESGADPQPATIRHGGGHEGGDGFVLEDIAW